MNNIDYALALQSDGKLLAGGEFTTVGGKAINRMARLQIDGVLDAGFNVGTGANAYVDTLALLPDGNVLAGGNFTQFNDLNHLRLVRVLTAASTTGSPFKFTSIFKEPNQVQMIGTGSVGQHYTLEYTRDFKTWTILNAVTATATTVQFTDTNPQDISRMYRVRSP